MSWKDTSNGMWYVEDSVRFFKMLKTLEVPAEVKTFNGSRCWFTGKTEDGPQQKPEESLDRAKATETQQDTAEARRIGDGFYE